MTNLAIACMRACARAHTHTHTHTHAHTTLQAQKEAAAAAKKAEGGEEEAMAVDTSVSDEEIKVCTHTYKHISIHTMAHVHGCVLMSGCWRKGRERPWQEIPVFQMSRSGGQGV